VETAKYSDTTSLTVNLPAINVLSKNIDYKRISISNFTNPGEQYVDLVNYYKEAVRIDNPSLNDSQVTTRAYELYMETSLPYAIGGLEYLLDWNANPVSRAEMHHNVSVYSFNSQSGGGIQGNRNPFVDYPELVDYIYGEFKDVPGNIKDLRPTFVDLEMDKDEIYNYAIGENYQNKYDVGDTISATSLDLKGVKYNFDIVDVDESVIDNPYTFIEDDIGYKEYSFATDKNDITIKLNVGESFVKASEFDASKNYYLSADGNNFATTTINSKGQLLMSSEDYASVTFEETDVEGQYYVKIEDKNGSIYLGYSGSGTNLTNNKTVWKVQYLNNGGFVLVEAGGRFLGLASKGATEAKAYAGSNLKVESNYPPVYLYIQK